MLQRRGCQMESDSLILRRALAFRPSGEWNDDDYDVLCNGVVVGRIMQAAAVPVGMSWMWTLAFGHHEDRTPTHGYAATREAAMAAFAKSWRGAEWRGVGETGSGPAPSAAREARGKEQDGHCWSAVPTTA